MLVVLLLVAALPLTLPAVVTCDVSTSGAAFGGYDSISSQTRDTSGTITVSCSGAVGEAPNYVIKLGTGSGTYAARSMNAGGVAVEYNLYTDSARSQVWGDGTSGTGTVGDSYTLDTTLPVTRSYTLYGRIPGGQSGATVAVYTDSVTVSLEY